MAGPRMLAWIGGGRPGAWGGQGGRGRPGGGHPLTPLLGRGPVSLAELPDGGVRGVLLTDGFMPAGASDWRGPRRGHTYTPYTLILGLGEEGVGWGCATLKLSRDHQGDVLN